MSVFWQMAAAKGLINMVNNSGESGHPSSLVPLSKVKLCEVSSLVVIVAVRVMYNNLIQLMNETPKPNRSNMEHRKFQLTLLNAFSA